LTRERERRTLAPAMIPPTVSAAFGILRALTSGNDAGALALASQAGQRRLHAIFTAPADPRRELLRGWKGSVKGRIDGGRALCSFADVGGGKMAVLSLVSEANRWMLDDVTIMDGAAFEAFGAVDDPNVLMYPPRG
jgi:hypothetical protein